ncbi:MAG: RidA family protein [Desulfobulbaceae bacterium]|nr:RidA family protein [Candidatus Kapabacteria bacterium]MBS4000233.1 RidA family protein [Desulfobulbaceae bacterium]
MKTISIPGALAPAGHYSPAIISGGLVYVSGILAIDPFGGTKLSDKDFAAQAEQVLANLELILNEAKSSLSKLLKVTVYITNISDWDEFNRIYASKLGDHKPARTVVPVKELHFGLKLELDAIATA